VAAEAVSALERLCREDDSENDAGYLVSEIAVWALEAIAAWLAAPQSSEDVLDPRKG
jgi:hypothetical protein